MYDLNGKILAVAPMMDWTDRHCRFFHRQFTRRALLYTEMVVADAVIHGDRQRLLGFDDVEHPVALQLGGSEPAKLAEAARIGEAFGYDEINLNVGCPSDRVQSGTFGACLMRTPDLVGDCVAAMKAAVRIPVTVKCRIGVDEQDPEIALDALAARVFLAGADALWVHARKAWLDGLSPKENRDIPPLDYPRVYRLKAAYPHKFIGINGGIPGLGEAVAHLGHVDGAMLGRAAYHTPECLIDVDRVVYGEAAQNRGQEFTPTPYPSPQGGGETERSATPDQSDGGFGIGPSESPSPQGGGETERSATPTPYPSPLRGGVRGGGMSSPTRTIDPTPFDYDALCETMCAYAARHIAAGGRLGHVTRHMVGLFHGQPGARRYRQILSADANRPGAGPEVLRAAFDAVLTVSAQAAE